MGDKGRTHNQHWVGDTSQWNKFSIRPSPWLWVGSIRESSQSRDLNWASVEDQNGYFDGKSKCSNLVFSVLTKEFQHLTVSFNQLKQITNRVSGIVGEFYRQQFSIEAETTDNNGVFTFGGYQLPVEKLKNGRRKNCWFLTPYQIRQLFGFKYWNSELIFWDPLSITYNLQVWTLLIYLYLKATVNKKQTS